MRFGEHVAHDLPRKMRRAGATIEFGYEVPAFQRTRELGNRVSLPSVDIQAKPGAVRGPDPVFCTANQPDPFALIILLRVNPTPAMVD